ncbi:hypothetical protein BaRGS_00011042 [Batillaria attramentaria]|uniref:NFX1-type zinc finger-containing protein 1-like n=1 Tax=Batillaria attramentaria TaxID=370345 RepID=A0ABD0LEA4_9CAEN
MDVDESNRRRCRRWEEHQQGVECDWRKDDTTWRRSDRAWREGDVGRRGSDGFEGRQETTRDRRELQGTRRSRGDWRGNFGTTERHRGWREKTERVSDRQGFYKQRPVGVADEVENWRERPKGGRDTHETWRERHGDQRETAVNPKERPKDRAERENSGKDVGGEWRETVRNPRESPRDNVRKERNVSQKEGRGDWVETARNPRESSRDNVGEERYVSRKEGRAEWRETARNPRERSGNGGERNNGRRETHGDWRNGAHSDSHKADRNWRQTESDLSDRDWRDRPTQPLEKPGEWREEESGGIRETSAEGKYFAHRSQNYDRTEGKEDCSAEARSDVSEDRTQCEDWREGNRTSTTHEQCSLASGNSERPGSTPQFAEDVLTLTRLAESSLLSLDNTRQVLQIVQRITASGQHREDILVVLQKVCSSQFLDKHLPILIRNLPVTHEEQSKSRSSVVETVKMIHLLVANICQSLPSYASKCILLLTYLIGERDVMSVIKNEMPSLEEDLKSLQEECEQCAEMVHNRPGRQARQMKYEATEDSAVPPQHFTEIPIFPTHADLNWDQKPFLRPNKAFGAYRDVKHYLDVQFRLLREDYIRPLREGFKEYRQMRDTGSTKRCRDLRIYRSVEIVGMTGGDSLEHVIQFDVSRLGHVHWQTSKRLPYGALLCLTQDDFETMYLAVVTHRDPMRLPSGFLQVEFESRLEDILQVSAGEVFTMAETPAYFEAYRHVLEALQLKVSAPYFPMERYIVKCQRHVLAPKYFARSGKRTLNLNAILRKKHSFHACSVPVNEPEKWPALQQTGLDASQLEALQNALTNELAIIQGPPGTGKTYVGLKITEVLLNNRDVWTDPPCQRPILVVCYTNHALDQFLEGILRICPSGVIRVGSRCTNPTLEKCNLREAKRRAHCVPCELGKRITTASEELSSLRGEIEDYRTQAEDVQNLRVLCHKVLEGCMLREHHDSLQAVSMYYGQSQSLMKDWLTFGAIAFDQEGEMDPYFLLARKVTSRILGGKDTLGEGEVDPTTVCSLPHRIRAQLYRFWHAQVMKKCNQATGGATGQNLGNVAVKTTQSLSAQSPSDQLHQPVYSPDEILPDEALKSVMNRRLYTAITGSMLQQHTENRNYCIRAWLGVHPSPAEMTPKILQGGKACREEDVCLDGILSTPRRLRVQLYRSWLQKVLEALQEQFENSKKSGRVPNDAAHVLKTAQSGILPDWVLKPVISEALFSTIQRHMLKKHEEQKCYMIRAWLGIDDFSQDACALETVLEKLTGKRQDKAITALKKAVDGEPEDTDIDTLIKQTDELRSKISPRVGKVGCEDDWTIPDMVRKPLEDESQRALKSSTPMTIDEASAVQNLWDMKMEERVRLYLFWVQKRRTVLKDRLRRAGENYVVTSRRYRELKLEEDVEVLKEATVIGMTTTRAARYHQVLDKIRCPIVILEEAAEVLEAHVVTTLHESCQHLILIGDHQQLRPSPTVYELCRHYQLDLSLFERLVNNELPHSTLAVQHRMRPEVARLVRHVYPHLEDHEVTLNRPHIRGMKHDVFLFDHEVSESTHRETNSKYNEYEADMVMKLCEYLRLQGYKSQSITVLAAYTGQLLRLKAIMQADMFRGIQVTSVDNFQGEENDVIILSLVRSNEEGSVGFLGTDNRVCVALSRARNGLYAFGNFRILSEKSKLWKKVVTTAKGNGQFGRAIVLRCENHPDTETHVSNPRDFNDVPEGGCKLPCDAHLHCGHSCRMLCHGYDRDHTEYRCMEQCQRQICELGLHPCPQKCHERCGTCQIKMEKIPQCGHTAMMECGTDPGTWTCPEPCEETLPCGHRCSGKCGQCRQKSHVTECKVQVERMLECGHMMKSQCHVTLDDLPCPASCGAKLDCGHDCPGTCAQCLGGRVHVPCKKPCGKALPGCGHKCTLPCGTKCLPCEQKCRSSCKHGTCTRQCGDPCQPCTEPCEKQCDHRMCNGTCDEPCESCSRPCTKTLKCGHGCRGYCGEECVCRLCDKTKYVRLSDDFLCGVSADGTTVRRAGRNEDNPHVANTNGAETHVSQGQGDPGGTDEENVTPDEGKLENATPNERKPENVIADEGKSENVIPDVGKPENVTPGAEKPENVTAGEKMPGNVAPEKDVILDEGKPENVTPVWVSDDEVSPQDQQDGANITGPTLDQVHAEEAAQTARADVRLIKLPRCGHVFDVDTLGAYVVAKLGTLPPGRGLSCPVCDKPILVWDCWSYSRLLRKRHSDQQEAKKKLKESTSVSEERKCKITTAIYTLPHHPKNRNSVSCRQAVARGFLTKKLDVNMAFALTSQCRLIRVVESVRGLLTKFPCASAKKITHHVDALETVLLQSMQSMSDQRFRELTAETRRLAYIAIQSCSKSYFTGNKELVQAISCLQMLEGNAVSQLPTEDMDKIFAECKKQNFWWETQVGRAVNVAILDAPSDEDLCDIVKTPAGFPRKVATERTFSIATTSAPKSLPRTLREPRKTNKRASSALVPPVPRRPAKAAGRIYNTATDLTDGIDAGSDVSDMCDVSDGSDDSN